MQVLLIKNDSTEDILDSSHRCVNFLSAGSILDISKYRDTCEGSISILGGIAILRFIEYRMNQ